MINLKPLCQLVLHNMLFMLASGNMIDRISNYDTFKFNVFCCHRYPTRNLMCCYMY